MTEDVLIFFLSITVDISSKESELLEPIIIDGLVLKMMIYFTDRFGSFGRESVRAKRKPWTTPRKVFE